jgi:hypothetical protein
MDSNYDPEEEIEEVIISEKSAATEVVLSQGMKNTFIYL